MKVKVLISWILQIIIAVTLGAAAAAKITGHEETVAVFKTLGMEPEGRYLIGGLEAMAAFLILVPQSVAWGALLGWGLMTGALIAHLTRLGFDSTESSMGLLAFLTWLFCNVVLYLRRERIELIDSMFGGESGKADSP